MERWEIEAIKREIDNKRFNRLLSRLKKREQQLDKRIDELKRFTGGNGK